MYVGIEFKSKVGSCMCECIAISNQKGGVGKSTTANAIGAGLFHRHKKVLYIDLDAQGNLSYSMGVGNDHVYSCVDVLTGKVPISEAVITTSQGDLLPSSPALSKIDSILTETGKEYRLREALQGIFSESLYKNPSRYDFVLIDTPPALGTLTINALTACNSVIIPSQADIYSLQGIGQLIQTLQAVQKYCNRDLVIRGFLLVRYSARAVISRDMTELLENTASQLSTKLYSTRIRECVALKEAQAKHQDIFTYAPKSNAAEDYRDLIEEIFGGN